VISKASRTREFILEKTAPLFNTKGYAGTSMLDLAAATGLTKGAIYGNFESKEAIALEVFKYSMERVRQVTREKMAAEQSAKGKLKILCDFYGQYVLHSPIPGGCPMINNAVEADDAQLFLKKTVSGEIKRTVDFIASLISEGKKCGEFKPDINAGELAQTFFCAIEGAIVMSRVSSSNAPMRAVLKHCNLILEQISI